MADPSHAALAKAAVRGMAWRYLSYISAKLMVFVSTVVLARLLSKDDFGLVGFAITAIVFLEVLSVGTGPAVIYFADDNRLATSAFWLGQAVGLGLFGLSWVLAPAIADFFHDARVIPAFRVLSLTFPIAAVGDIHAALLQKWLAFDRIFIPELLLAMVKGLSSIALAFWGFGAWSLIWGQLAATIASSAAYWIVAAWRPSFTFDLQLARSIMGYGLRYISSDVISVFVLNLDYLLVGRYLGSVALGVYTLAFRLPDLLVMQIVSLLSGVLFPLYSQMRDVPGSVARGFLATTRYVSLLTVPLGVGMALVAQPLVTVFFTDKWADAVPVIRAIALYAVFRSFAYNAGSAYKAQGKPQVITWIEGARLAILLPALWWAVTQAQTIVAVGWTQAAVSLAASIFDLSIAARILRMSAGELAVALRPALVAGTVMAGAVLAALQTTALGPSWLQLTSAVAVGAIVYVACLRLVQPDVITDAGGLLRRSFGRSVP
jgi:O-antigen/teichoic acid export membrane protein